MGLACDSSNILHILDLPSGARVVLLVNEDGFYRDSNDLWCDGKKILEWTDEWLDSNVPRLWDEVDDAHDPKLRAWLDDDKRFEDDSAIWFGWVPEHQGSEDLWD